MIKIELINTILELCDEDHYGVWELYWNYQGIVGAEKTDDDFFVRLLIELVDTQQIVPYEKDASNPIALDVERLKEELIKTKKGDVADGFYWFGKPPRANSQTGAGRVL